MVHEWNTGKSWPSGQRGFPTASRPSALVGSEHQQCQASTAAGSGVPPASCHLPENRSRRPGVCCVVLEQCPARAALIPEDRGLQDGPAHLPLYRRETGPAWERTHSSRLARPRSGPALLCAPVSRNRKLGPSPPPRPSLPHSCTENRESRIHWPGLSAVAESAAGEEKSRVGPHSSRAVSSGWKEEVLGCPLWGNWAARRLAFPLC